MGTASLQKIETHAVRDDKAESGSPTSNLYNESELQPLAQERPSGPPAGAAARPAGSGFAMAEVPNRAIKRTI